MRWLGTYRRYLLILVVVFNGIPGSGQVKFQSKAELTYLKYGFRPFIIDFHPGADYPLKTKQSGFSVSSINGISLFKGILFTGVGIGYLNFQGIHGLSSYIDVEVVPLKSRWRPIFGLRGGYNHIWNQYEGGSGLEFFYLNSGVSYQAREHMALYLKSGIFYAQWSIFIPITLGIRF